MLFLKLPAREHKDIVAEELNIIKVKIADYKVAKAPFILSTSGLGSCVGLSLYDKKTLVGSLLHIMLPKAGENVNPEFMARYADTAMRLAMKEMEELGCNSAHMVAKLAGGASMFSNLKKNTLGVGERNVEAVLEILESASIPVEASDTGGDYGRSIEFDTATGDMRIRSIMHGIKTI